MPGSTPAGRIALTEGDSELPNDAYTASPDAVVLTMRSMSEDPCRAILHTRQWGRHSETTRLTAGAGSVVESVAGQLHIPGGDGDVYAALCGES